MRQRTAVGSVEWRDHRAEILSRNENTNESDLVCIHHVMSREAVLMGHFTARIPVIRLGPGCA